MEKSLVARMMELFNLQSVTWAQQIILAKRLLKKYSYEEIEYALEYYHDKGVALYSLGLLLYKDNMRNPVSLYKAEQNSQNSEESGERNRKRIQQLQQTEYGTSYPCYLFTETTGDS